jgi:hypothetical protein
MPRMNDFTEIVWFSLADSSNHQVRIPSPESGSMRGLRSRLRMPKGFRLRLEALWRVLEHFGEYQRPVLAMTTSCPLQMDLRVLSIQHRWHLVFAQTLHAAVEFQGQLKNLVVLYDRDLPGTKWRHGIGSVLECSAPACVILLSREVDSRLQRTALDCGCYDVARKPVEPETLARLVNGAFMLAQSADSMAQKRDQSHLAHVR